MIDMTNDMRNWTVMMCRYDNTWSLAIMAVPTQVCDHEGRIEWLTVYGPLATDPQYHDVAYAFIVGMA